MSEQLKSEIFAAWLDGALSPEQQQQFEQFCVEDSAFSERVEQANQLNMLSEVGIDAEVPQWNKEATFEFTKTHWWQSPKLSVASLAFSAFAVVMALSGLSVNVTDGQMTIAFNKGLTTQQVDQLVQAQLDDYQQTNQQMFAQYVDALNSQQQKSSAQLTEYLLSSSRQERREDFAELIKFINEQRSDDQVYYARQLNKLQQEIYAQSGVRLSVPTISADQSQSPQE